jgi:hypothetical protein
MTGPGGERADLTAFLAAQRQAVLDIIDGLDETALRRTVLPSGWTPLGLIEHLGGAERFWFQYILTGELSELPWPESSHEDEDEDEDEDAPFTTGHPVDEVLAFYRDTGDAQRAHDPAAHDRGDGAARRPPGRRAGTDRRPHRPGPALAPARRGAQTGRHPPGEPAATLDGLGFQAHPDGLRA